MATKKDDPWQKFIDADNQKASLAKIVEAEVRRQLAPILKRIKALEEALKDE